MTDKLRPGDVFQFGAGTLLEQVMSIADGELEQFLFFNRNARRRSGNEVEVYTKPLDTQYLVISATPTHQTRRRRQAHQWRDHGPRYRQDRQRPDALCRRR